jgi:hypothetical protein
MPSGAQTAAASISRCLAAALCVVALALQSSPAQACGTSGPDGVWSCSLAEHDEQERPRWSVGAVTAFSWTKLRFGDGLNADMQRSAVLATMSYAPMAALRIQASAGVTPTGQLRVPDGTHDFLPGPTGALGVTYRLLEDKPFLVLSGLLSASSSETERRAEPADSARYTALDLRLGAAVGVTFLQALSLYAVARVFGGPVFWHYQGEARTGTDAYHVQLGAGLAWRIARKLDLFAEGVPLGERGISGGAAVVF